MKIKAYEKFRQSYQKLPLAIQRKVERQLSLLAENRYHPIVPSHFQDRAKECQQMENGKTGAKEPRPIGLAKEIFQAPPEFFDELPEELLDEFHGNTVRYGGNQNG